MLRFLLVSLCFLFLGIICDSVPIRTHFWLISLQSGNLNLFGSVKQMSAFAGLWTVKVKRKLYFCRLVLGAVPVKMKVIYDLFMLFILII